MDALNGLVYTVLSDDHAEKPFFREHGFALAICFGERSILFDTGQGAFVENAALAGVDIGSFSACVISHGHYDHTGGIAELLVRNSHIHIWAHRDVCEPHYRDADGAAKNLSVPDSDCRALLKLPAHRLHLVSASTSIAPGVGIVCPIPRVHPLEDTGGRFFRDHKLTQPDPIDDELALWIRHEKGLIIVTGCCHAGFINTCEAVKKETGFDRVHAVIGGFHLQSAADERIAATCDYIIQEGMSAVVPCHCTGLESIEKMRTRLGGIVRDARCGERFDV